MYYKQPGILEMPKLDTSPKSPSRELFLDRTWTRDQLFMNVSHNTVDESYKFPCTTVGGPRMGSPCSFPFVYPDCSERFDPMQFM